MSGPAAFASETVRRRLSVVIPAFNEEANIEECVRRVTAAAERLTEAHEILVVDDGSRDATARIVARLSEADPRVRLIRHEANAGYGEALRSGFEAATLDLVFLIDADNQFDPNELALFMPLIERVDVVAGYRINRRDGATRLAAARAWNVLVRALFYVPVRDIDCAFKLFRRSVFAQIDLESVGAMVSTELMLKLGRSGHRIVEVGVHHYPRRFGEARGIKLSVVVRAFTELASMYRRLSRSP